MEAKKKQDENFLNFFDDGVYSALFAAEKLQVSVAFGTALGQSVYAICQNGEAMQKEDAQTCCKTLFLAAKTGTPVVTFYNSKGSVLTDGFKGLASLKRLNEATAQVSGVVPQIAVITGVCGASNAMAAASADICIMEKDAQLFLTPPFVSAANGDALAGAGGASFASKAGVAAMVAQTAKEAAQQAAKLVAMLPQNNLSEAAQFAFELPTQNFASKSEGLQQVQALADNGSLMPLYEGFGNGANVYFGTVAGMLAGFVATMGEASYLGEKCMTKIARFVRLCDAFNIPIITIVNTGGIKKSSSADEAGNLRLAARLAAAYADATTAKVAVICGKACGTAYMALCNADLTIAVQGAVIAMQEPAAVVSVLDKKEIANAKTSIEKETQSRVQKFVKEQASAKAAAEAGLADMFANLSDVRTCTEVALNILFTKRTQRMPKKHGNMAL